MKVFFFGVFWLKWLPLFFICYLFSMETGHCRAEMRNKLRIPLFIPVFPNLLGTEDRLSQGNREGDVIAFRVNQNLPFRGIAASQFNHCGLVFYSLPSQLEKVLSHSSTRQRGVSRKKTVYKLPITKIKNIYVLKNTFQKVKRQPIKWDKIFVNI